MYPMFGYSHGRLHDILLLTNINENISHLDMFYRLMSSNSILCVRNVAMFIYSILLLKGNSILTYICSYYAVILTLLYVSLQLHTVHCVFVCMWLPSEWTRGLLRNKYWNWNWLTGWRRLWL